MMLKNLLKKGIFTLATAALLSTSANAQIVWGAGSSNTRADSVGRFINTGNTTNSTTVGWHFTSNTNTAAGNIITWESTKNRNSTYAAMLAHALYSDYDLVAPSSEDGMVFFYSDYYYRLDGTAPQHAAITSETFSLAGYENSNLNLNFHTSLFHFISDTTAVAFSTDNGTTWNYIDLPTELGLDRNDAYRGEVSFNITPFIANATSLNQCKIRFTFKGDSHVWLVDDVNISLQPEYDITISGGTSGTQIVDYFTTARVANSMYTPINQMSEDEFMMGVRALNKGYADIPLSLNPRIELTIEKQDGSGNWVLETTQTLPFDSTIVAGGRDFQAAGLADMATPWLPTSEGVYRASYFVTHDGTDGSTLNDRQEQFFMIEENNSIYSKVDLSSDGFPFYDAAVTPAAFADATTKITKLEWGSMFYFPNGAETVLESVAARLYVPTAANVAPSFTSGSMTARVYEYTPNSLGNLDDDPVGSGQLLLKGIGTVTVPVSAGNASNATMNILDVTTEEEMILENNKIYYVSLIQENSSGLSETSGANQLVKSFSIGTQTDLDYGFNMGFMDAMPSVLSITEVINNATPNTTWYGNGFGPTTMPSLMLNLADTIVAVNKTVNINNLSVFPNPTADILNVSVDLEKASDVQYIITDIAGRVVRMNTTANVQNETVTFNVADLAAGVYTVTVKSDKGISTEKFVRQ